MTTTETQFKPGDRVRVCVKSLRLDLSGPPGLGSIRDIPADPSCEKHEHWESRIVEWVDFRECWNIAIPCRGKHGNPNHAEWIYRPSSLTLIEDDKDWTRQSKFKIGMQVWAENPKWHHRGAAPGSWESTQHLEIFGGRRFGPATLLLPHIEPGDWYLGFPWQAVQHDHKVRRDVVVEQVFRKVVNESEFVPEGTS
jgi:hypothetical protein